MQPKLASREMGYTGLQISHVPRKRKCAVCYIYIYSNIYGCSNVKNTFIKFALTDKISHKSDIFEFSSISSDFGQIYFIYWHTFPFSFNTNLSLFLIIVQKN